MKKIFNNYLSTYTLVIDFLSFFKSNDPTVITRDYDNF